MTTINMKRNQTLLTAMWVVFSFLIAVWVYAIFYAPSERNQGEVYRIIYIHVPFAFSSFLCAFFLFYYGLSALVTKQERFLFGQRAAAELGVFFTIITLATGSIWAKPTWNVWWTWDARLTTTLLLAVLFAAYLLLYHNLNDSRQRRLPCSILAIIILANVPIIYQSVNWWRTLHQPQTILRRGGSTIDPEMLKLLLTSIFLLLIFTAIQIIIRYRNLYNLQQLENFDLLRSS